MNPFTTACLSYPIPEPFSPLIQTGKRPEWSHQSLFLVQWITREVVVDATTFRIGDQNAVRSSTRPVVASINLIRAELPAIRCRITE